MYNKFHYLDDMKPVYSVYFETGLQENITTLGILIKPQQNSVVYLPYTVLSRIHTIWHSLQKGPFDTVSGYQVRPQATSVIVWLQQTTPRTNCYTLYLILVYVTFL